MKSLVFILFFFFSFSFSAFSNPGDNLIAYQTSNVPLIDGDSTDVAWSLAPWVDINYTWIPYNATIPSDIFNGRFKVLWSKTTNLLYFLVEITDSKFVNGYVFSPNDGSYPNYDAVEVFLDEDRPGGTHTFDNTAFAYHITSGNSFTDHYAIDIWGSNWGSNVVNYSNHLPEFKRVNIGTKYYWEFSMMVIKSTFKPTDDPTLFKAELVNGKKMGLSVAYCDNNNSATNPTRDFFFGSKFQTQANSNNSYMDSSIFGNLTLADTQSPSDVTSVSDYSASVSVNEAKQLIFKLNSGWSFPVVQITDISGKVMLKKRISNDQQLDISALHHGCYLVVMKENNQILTKKIVL